MPRKEKSPFLYSTAQVGFKGIDLTIPLSKAWCEEFAPPEGGTASGPGNFSGKLVPSGSGFVLKGKLAGGLSIPCNRCLDPVDCSYDSDFTHYYSTVEEDAEEEGVGITAILGDEIDVEPIMGEELVIALPTYVLCKEGCKGLCVQCGANLNQEDCSCEAPMDPRWDKLKALKL